MRGRLTLIPTLLALALAIPFAGCGDGNNDNIFIGTTPTPGNGRTPTPVHTSTPGAGNETATPADQATPTETPAETPTGSEPTATATPSGPACKAGDQVVVTETVDKSYGGLRIELKYPQSVTIPGTGSSTDSTRVTGTPSGGFVQVVDAPTTGSFDDTLTIAFAGTTDHAAGPFAVITFDCVEGQSAPSAGELTCTVASASTGGGVPITDENCTLSVTGP